MQMLGVVFSRHRTADRALPPVAIASALRAHERLVFHVLIISRHGNDERGPPVVRRRPVVRPLQAFREAVMPRYDKSAPATKITTAR